MSKTRIVKGTYNKISHESHNMYSHENIITRALRWISEKGKEKGVTYNIPKSAPLIQSIKLIVNFRPKKDWKGEFGFDWIREGDTKLFNDNRFTDVVAYQYTDTSYTTKVAGNTSHNKYDGSFKPDINMYNELVRQYKPFTIPWRTVKDKKSGKEIATEYYTPWMSIIKDQEVSITFFAEIKDEADYLEFSKSDYFTFNPNKIPIKGQKKIALNKYEIKIKCTKEFSSDQVIELKAFKQDNSVQIESLVGRISVWANNKAKHKEKKVVFVQVQTPEINGKSRKPNVKDEKDRINQYLAQAYIKLADTSDIVDLDLSSEKDFNDFITTNQIDSNKKNGGKSLNDYLKNKLEKAYPKKYDKHFKAFYFEENGYHPSGGFISGYSAHGADYVVLFKSKDNQTAAHEFLHSMNLPHTFTNKDSSTNALFTYEYRKTDNLLDYSHHGGNNNKRCSLFYWQWKIANSSIK